jgi:integrase
VQEWVNRLAARRAPNTVKRIYTVLKAVLRMAVERRYIVTSPCEAVRLPRKRNTGKARERMLFLTPDEVRGLADAMPTPAYRLAIYVAAYCGLRAGELWGLRRSDIDPLRKTITVAQALKEVYSSALAKAGHDPDELGLFVGEPKSAAAHRTLTMPAFVAAMMAEHLAVPSPGGNGPSDFVFTVPTGEPVAHSNFYERVFSPVVRGRPARPEHQVRTGNGWRTVPAHGPIPSPLPPGKRRLRFHDLRHTCASLSLAIEPSLHIVKERLGHEDIGTTVNIYGHLLPSVDEALAARLDSLHTAPPPTPNVTDLRVAVEA